MKIFYLLTTLLVLFSSCQKEISSEQPRTSENGASSGTFVAVIDGKSWQAASDRQEASIIGGITGVSGVSSTGQSILISLVADKAGTYNVYYQDYGAVAYSASQDAFLSYSTNGSEDSSKAGGQVVISSIDTVNKRIKGTFDVMVAVSDDQLPVKITGEFDLSYKTTISNSNGEAVSSTDTIKTKIDGTAWSAPVVSGTLLNGLMLSGSDQDMSKTLGLVMPADTKPGTYSLDGLSTTTMVIYNEGKDLMNAKHFIADAGSFTVLENDNSKKRIRGTFELTVSDLLSGEKRKMTEGYFNVGYK